tara:strand:+ start:121528 stop:122286 length:759 start_codon:yes stop_codon:yes gene_type:complete
LFVYSTDSTSFNFSLNKSDTSGYSASAFEIINIETEIQGITVFKNKIPAYKKLLFLRLGDSTVIKIGSGQIFYDEQMPKNIEFSKVDAQKLGKNILPPKNSDDILVQKEDQTKLLSEPTDDLLRYSYKANDSLNATDFVLPAENTDTTSISNCNYTLSDKDLKRLKSKLKIFPDAYDQKRMLEEDLEFTCFTTEQLGAILKNINDDEAKFLLIRNIWHQCSDPKNLIELGSTFLLEIYQKDYIDFLENRLYE